MPFADDIRRAIPTTLRPKLPDLSAAVWKGFACGAITEDEAQELAEAIAARKAVPATPPPPRRVGSRPRAPESLERRRRWMASGWLPPQLAARFTMGELAVLSVVGAEIARRGLCRLALGHIGAMAGVCRTTVKNALHEARALGLITSEEWRITAWRNAPNTVRIVSAEWRTWLRARTRSTSALAEQHARECWRQDHHGSENRGGGVKSTTGNSTSIHRRGQEPEEDPTRRDFRWKKQRLERSRAA